jgi:hypothetical protein
MLSQHSKKHHAGAPNIVPDPLVDPGNPPAQTNNATVMLIGIFQIGLGAYTVKIILRIGDLGSYGNFAAYHHRF